MRENRNGLDSLEDAMKNGYGYLINNSGKIIALITAVVAVLVTFTDVSFAAITADSLSTSLFVMLAASYLTYFSLEDAGERLGEESEEFSSSLEHYTATKNRIRPSDISPLREYCHRYSLSELEYRKKSVLASLGLSEEEYEAYRLGTDTAQSSKRIFRRIERMKPARLTPSVLLSRERISAKSELDGPTIEKRASTLLSLFPTTVGTFLTVSVILTTKDTLTAATVMEGLIKLSALPIVGFKGYQSGYFYAKNKKSLWLQTKTRILEEFIESKGKSTVE